MVTLTLRQVAALLLVAVLLLWRAPVLVDSPAEDADCPLAANIRWDRERPEAECEGFWAPLPSGRPFPRRHPQPFPEPARAEFLRRLEAVEAHAKEAAGDGGRFRYLTFRGLANCRMHDEGETAGCDGLLGNAEVRDTATGMCWPAGGPAHYLAVHNVYPSHKFFRYIMCSPLPV